MKDRQRQERSEPSTPLPGSMLVREVDKGEGEAGGGDEDMRV